MLYQDPELRRLHSFLAWARAQPPEVTFNYWSRSCCAVCQFTGLSMHEWDDNAHSLNECAGAAFSAAKSAGVSRFATPYAYLVAAIEERIAELTEAAV